ncbi:glucose-1-phosphate thymidylyltransferase [Clostridium botulinum]|uniref:glucose-1-phosphate thymidylyltransferase n=1 Tax=Clostridium botulinum TaxID=1491 RepID=UPI000D35477F|nr:glucose-1-phosphate thymidylyltransferase [Clostridium botulinum]AWB30703.1 glucose-1-phosphate thymidylyltransferase [Clostridium botulinum]MBY6830051.1 glucose-1-phosphate thymidylyltransferase [Clostridium botulinum]MBY6961829.1 glucose-1-phosphate thymidylyltransferase [Clostridium botulinum]
MKALILSGGTGTRLRPLTYTNAKQLLPLANKPILFYIIEKIVKAGIYDIGIIVGDTREEVKKMVGNGDRWGVKISYLYQPMPLGLAHAVKTASEFLMEDDFLMVLGDNVFNMELNKLIDSFYSNNANSALLLHKVENPSQYGVAVVEDTLIIKLVEKPKEFVSDLIITGVYIFDKSIFMAIDNIKPSQRGELEITDAIQKQLETGGRVTYELIQGWWKDTGQLQDILEANRLMLDEIDCEFKTLPQSNSVFMGKIQIGKNVIIENSTIIGPVAIADDTTITNSCIGPYTSIDKAVTVNDCEIDNCIILENAKIDGIHKRISGSLIGRKIQIKELHKRPFSHTFLLGDDSEIDL